MDLRYWRDLKFFRVKSVLQMGNGQSRTNRAYLKAVGAPPMMPRKRSKHQDYQLQGTEVSRPVVAKPRCKTAFFGVWSLLQAPLSEVVPSARSRQISVYDDVRHTILIVYGVDALGNYVNDSWELSINGYKWSRVNLSLPESRINASCTKVGRELIIFGGRNRNGDYLANLHSINLDSGAVTVFPCTREPPGRESACLFATSEKVYVWSGNNGKTLTDLCVYSRGRGDWVEFRELEDVIGRQYPSFVQSQLTPSMHYVFGSTQGHPLMTFDTESETFQVMKCSGTAPPSELQSAMVTVADEFLFVIGGVKESQFTYVYGLDVRRHQWFAFYVAPDNETTTEEDGNWSKVGIFQLPRQFGGVLHYCPETRSLVSVMGSLYYEPPPISVISIGQALGFLHLRSDLAAMLNVS